MSEKQEKKKTTKSLRRTRLGVKRHRTKAPKYRGAIVSSFAYGGITNAPTTGWTAGRQ